MKRRQVLVGAGLAAAAALCGPTACSSSATETYTLTAGEPGQLDNGYAELLASALRQGGLAIEARPTGGSIDSLRRLTTVPTTVALALADSAQAAVLGEEGIVGGASIRGIGRLYQAYTQLAVLDESPATSVADLAGRRVCVGSPDSGTSMLGRRLFTVADVSVQMDSRPTVDAVAALEQGQADALLWTGGVPTTELAALGARRSVRLLDLGGLASILRAAYGNAYEAVAIPSGTYQRVPSVDTVGVPYLLLCREDTDRDVVALILRTLLAEPTALAADPPFGKPFPDPRELIDTPIPIHPAAVEVYREWHR